MKDIVKYIYEIGQLKIIKRSGWWRAGIKCPESIAEHSFRTAIIGYILGKLEGADYFKILAMCLFHDVHEVRINDINKIGKKYLKHNINEAKITEDQIINLPKNIFKELLSFQKSFVKEDTSESIIAKDADLLECLVQAREYQSQGYKDVVKWIVDCKSNLITESAKKLADYFIQNEPSDWWGEI